MNTPVVTGLTISWLRQLSPNCRFTEGNRAGNRTNTFGPTNLPLGVLWGFSGAFQTRLLTFLNPCIAG